MTKAIFTIVNDEKYFLPIWLEYYKQYFSNDDIYILNHDTKDGSTGNLDVNVENISNNVLFSHEWLLEQVKRKQKELLLRYDIVVFAEIDEIIVHKQMNLSDYIESIGTDYVACTGYQLVHKEETDFDNSKLILEQRNYWYKDSVYDKCLISKIPLEWTGGFHTVTNINPPKNDENLILLHIHSFDKNICLQRHSERISKSNIESGNAGLQNKFSVDDKKAWLQNQLNVCVEIDNDLPKAI